MKLKHLTSVIFILCIFSISASAQFNAINTGKLQVYASIKEGQEKLKKVDIVLMEDAERNGNWVEVQRLKTPASGEFRLDMDYGSLYQVTISKEGYTTKKVNFDTDVHGETINSLDFYFIADMVPDKGGIAYLKAVATIFYDANKKAFDYDLNNEKADAVK